MKIALWFLMSVMCFAQTKDDILIDSWFSGFSKDTVVFEIYKLHPEMRVFAKRGSRYELVTTFPICAVSGYVGPKEKTGDCQVPEGFYEVTYFKPHSSFKALGVNYPNKTDKLLGRTGSGIQIHGNCCSVGCISFENPNMYKIYEIASRAKKVYVWILPSRNIEVLTKTSKWMPFWKSLFQIIGNFEKTGQIPNITFAKTYGLR